MYSIGEDPRTEKLVTLLSTADKKMPEIYARGLIVSLLNWGSENAADGDFGRFDRDFIAAEIKAEFSGHELFGMLTESGFVDAENRMIDFVRMLDGYRSFFRWLQQDD